MNFTYNERYVNKARSEILHDGQEIPIRNKIFIRSLHNPRVTGYGSRIQQTIRSQSDRRGGGDVSQYIHLKSATKGNSFVGNR